MTDYGRGSGSEPWHPEDPLFGDVYDQGHGYPQQPQHPQQDPQQQPPHQEDGGWQDPYATGQQPPYPPQQGYPQQPYPQQGQYPQQPHQPQQPQNQPYGQGQPQQPYPQGQPQQPYPQQGYPQQAGYDPYDTGSHQTGGYGQQDPYGGQQQPQDPYGQPDFYGQNGYPPPQQPQYRQQQMPQQQGQGAPGQDQGLGQPVPGQPVHPQQGQQAGQSVPSQAQPGHPQEAGARPSRTAPADPGGWDPEEEGDPREHAFFADRHEDDDAGSVAPADTGRRSGKSQPKGGKKRRSGCACLVLVVVMVGGLGGVGYFGYSFYQSHFGPAPDYTGAGTATDVQVTVPTGATAAVIGRLLKDAGVVKSVDAFVSAADKNTKSRGIQSGVYVLKSQMSAAAAVTLMLDPSSQNAFIIPEGTRDQQIYAMVDKRLGLAAGSTAKAARAQVKNLGLPAWADTSNRVKDPLEGFLFPSRYSVAKGMKPEALLRQMIGEAKKQYAQFDMAAEARKQGLTSPLQLLTVASLVQAEGKTDDDFRKMAKVIYNRKDPSNTVTNGLLQFDSTYNYIRGASSTKISLQDIKTLKDTYNTYVYRGLPPGPIGNPGIDALKAAMNPDTGNWWWFISLDDKTTKFTETKAEFDKLYAQYNAK
ncbi:endolytic transglycosylase MltG [Streptomyces polygonati]|uniref:Endolytic murein transglycosylase n=1 Tax=Streptomyces polygonati TaxID=1617087 RepID=A0ABV8HMK1_9ACTN